MNLKIISLVYALLSLHKASSFPLNKRSCEKTYNVIKGDTCYNIWKKYGLTETEFKNLNLGVNCNNLQIGTSLCVSSSSASSPSSSSCKTFYTVKKGDYCYKIWNAHGLSESTFRSLNPHVNCENLQIDTQVCVKTSSTSTTKKATATATSTSNSSSCSTHYTVVKNDTCYNIWTKYNLSESTFRSFNSNVNCENLQIGTQVCVKASTPTTTTTTTTTTKKATTTTTTTTTTSSCSKHYTVVKNDTCYNIWTKYNLSESTFRSFNPNVNCENLQIGTQVCVKASTPTNASTPTTATTTTTTTTKKVESSVTSNASPTFTWLRECQTENNYALSFDDGIYLYDEDLLDLLKRKGVKVTFFINGNNVSSIKTESVRNTIKRAYQEGHNILSHTWSHKDLTTCSSDTIRSELKLLEDEIYAIIGQRPKSIRPPYMAGINDSRVINTLQSYGYSYGILWKIDSRDWENKGDINTILHTFKTGLATSHRPIILNHSFYEGITKEKLLTLVEKEIDYLSSMGLTGVNMETCIGHKVYRNSGEGF
ncbi:glycoside hydrolase/deacetylase, partial [Piromyces finnis]